ncbi:chemotaxis protein CheA [Gorillibacterium timonense]|uniref:chemotaxis protein CheA n=1 Tax=Gorillibacterium timonense TaxID=1689269 RepID=UPI001F29B1E0|nr:chemotaxis protein CheA [Gorillibacterium timonense]
MELSAYREIFIEELNDQLERIDQSLLELEREKNPDVIQTLFRAAHTIKGSSSTMGFREMSELTHEVEFALEWVREHKPDITAQLIDTLFRALDAMKSLRDHYIGDEHYDDFGGVVSAIKTMVKNGSGSIGAANVESRRIRLTLGAEAVRQAQAAVAAGYTLQEISVELQPDCPMKAVRYYIMLQRFNDLAGEVIASTFEVDELSNAEDDERYGSFQLIVAAKRGSEELQAMLLAETEVIRFDIQPFLLQGTGDKRDGEANDPEPRSPSMERAKAAGQSTVRVNVERLDHLMNLVGELLIEQTSLTELSHDTSDPSRSLQDAGHVADRIGTLIKELQEGVMKTRMLPIDQLFSRFPRMVRDLAQKLDKDIELITHGGETELDRMIIEELSDPLIHLIRNSADHGIETPEIRLAAGKPAKGRITLSSYYEENHVVVALRDDGQGIDAERIKASAVRKGIIKEGTAASLGQQEAVHLIFEPGFSTAAEVSDVSGRGVGMDIVRSQIGRLNGLIDIETKVGEGTCFIIRLPLTLAIIKGLLVKVSGRLFVIPMYNVGEVVRIHPDKIQTVQGKRTLLNHGRIVPFRWLHEKLNYAPTEKTGTQLPVVIVRSADAATAYAVDEIIGNQEVVIKKLSGILGNMNHLSGATILGNGTVALILDAAYLVSHSKG